MAVSKIASFTGVRVVLVVRAALKDSARPGSYGFQLGVFIQSG
jgi:hypothetical protein